MPEPLLHPPSGPTAPPPRAGDDRLADARLRRRELQLTLAEVEHALAAPAPGRAEPWAAGVRAALDRLATDLHRHVEVTEGDGGLYRDVLGNAPRLARAVARLEREHTDLRQALDAARERLAAPEDGDAWVAETRDRVTAMLGLFSRHRQRGADLVYEAYDTDIGGTG